MYMYSLKFYTDLDLDPVSFIYGSIPQDNNAPVGF